MEHAQKLTSIKTHEVQKYKRMSACKFQARRVDHQKALAEMKLLRKTAGYTLSNDNRNELITEELKATPTAEYVQQYSRNWLQHINRMERSKIPRQMLHYVPK
jgi:hypothetical protein